MSATLSCKFFFKFQFSHYLIKRHSYKFKKLLTQLTIRQIDPINPKKYIFHIFFSKIKKSKENIKKYEKKHRVFYAMSHIRLSSLFFFHHHPFANWLELTIYNNINKHTAQSIIFLCTYCLIIQYCGTYYY